MSFDQLKLKNQLCFPLYAASRLVTRHYQPHLEKLGITYPQYLVLMILWENNALPVNDIAKTLILNTNTITPLLQRMEKQGLVLREKSMDDERKVIVKLTEKGEKLKTKASSIPENLATEIMKSDLTLEDLIKMKEDLSKMIDQLSKK